MKAIKLLSLVLALGAVVVSGACNSNHKGQGQGGETAASQTELYQCPMHPTVTSEEPGDCPICGMRLVPVEQDAPTSAGASQAPNEGRKILYWVAPMDSSYRSDKPGKSPMGMDLVPVYEDEVGGESQVEGRATVTIDTRRTQLIGVRMSTVEVTDATRSLRTVGFVEADNDRIHHVHTRVDGWLEKVNVQTEGDPVRKGQVLFELYSPQLVATQEELLAAVRSGNKRAANAARDRLRYWNVSDSEIKAIEKSGETSRRIAFRSPVAGFVKDHKAVEGMYVKEMTELYTLMNLEDVWVIGKFYETDLPLLRNGAEAKVQFPDGETITGKAEYIYPRVDPKTRFASARFVFPNDNLRLLPGMYVDLDYEVDLGTALVAPRDSVIRTGTQNLAFVEIGQGHFEPRRLDLGPETDGGYVVYGGLDDGDRVVDQAAFFVDSESSLKAALAKFTGGDKSDKADKPAADHSGH